MSESTSPSSPSQGSTWTDFAGAQAILDAWREGLRPDPALTVSEWADHNRVLSQRASAEPGLWRTSRVPYTREPMDCLSPTHPAQIVVVQKGTQLAFTELGNNWLGFLIDHAPGPILAVQPTTQMAKRFSRQRIDDLVAETPALRSKVKKARARDSGNTVLSKEFPGGILVMTGANSAVGLRSMPARYLFLDEAEAYPADLDDEGDPVDLAIARTATFSWRRKVYMPSSPKLKLGSRITRYYAMSDQRRYFVPCPHCGEYQDLEFERLRWAPGAPQSVAYVCRGCERPIAEHHKPRMLGAGQWRATVTPADRTIVGFHISSLYSPVGWLSWEEIARKWEAAQADDSLKKTFFNTILGEAWDEPGEAPEWERLYDRREPYPIARVQPGVLLITAGVDVQGNRLEVEIVGWGPGQTSWSLGYRVLEGDPGQDQVWRDLDELIAQGVEDEEERHWQIDMLAIDSGFQTQRVYAWARRRERVMVIKGSNNRGAIAISGPKPVDLKIGQRTYKHALTIRIIGTRVLKEEWYRLLRLEPPREAGKPFPPGYVHVPEYGPEWFKGATAEKRVRSEAPGRETDDWVKTGPNEPLDCRVYAMAAARHPKIRIDEMTTRRWTALARARGVSLPDPPAREPVATPAPSEARPSAASPSRPETAPQAMALPVPAASRPAPRPMPRRPGGFVGSWRF